MNSESSSSLTIALSKGRILKETLPLLASAGIEPLEQIDSSRKLIFETTQAGVHLIVIRATDVPVYVEYGGADIGVTGKDVLMEHGAEGVSEMLDLNIARCKLMTASLANAPETDGRIKVATKFVNLAKAYYAEKGVQADVIKLYGAMELAPVLGLADEIVDIVDTGNTLRANGLEPREIIESISARLVVNSNSLKLKHEKILPLIAQLESAVNNSK